ncbi:hypothetical protein B0H67DRAFT_567726 [Lasiosphaeris hirsuta]|uniref:Oxidoreductase n=1 Tax=Lasiosphaeris hirsuta TaxID=260670 RepID=A0AA40AYI3_9PEZI|nr:hypothetical protein B0H67DRAFT_567726 [Lasiosphaeris hirsuta]
MGILSIFGGSSGVSFNPATDIPSQASKVILVTGGNSGLGKESILALAKYGSPAVIWLGARSAERAQAAIDDIHKAAPGAVIKAVDLDLSSFDSIKAAARRVLAESDRLDTLMLNAGIMATPPAVTKEGYEIQFGTNHVGHALLTKLLLPLIQKTMPINPDVRIIVLASIGHQLAPKEGILFDTVKSSQENISSLTKYGQSKLSNIFFAAELARRYPQIKSVAIHPGPVNTNLAVPFTKSNKILGGIINAVAAVTFVTPEKGAQGQLWAATAPSDAVISGEYYTPVGKLGQGTTLSKDAALAARLWEWTEKELEGQTV